MIAQINLNYIKTRPFRLWSRLVAYICFEGRPLTTRGQWINPFLFCVFTILKKLPLLRKPTAPIFILGTGRSGTTILGTLLSMHKDVGFLNEPKAIWASLRDDEDLIGSYHRGKASYRLEADHETPKVAQAAHRIFGAFLRISMTRRLVDKYPELIFRLPFVRQIFPDAKFLFLSRNGWDTCSSIDKWSKRLGNKANGEIHDWWGLNRRKWNLIVDELVKEHTDLAPNISIWRELDDHRAMAAIEWIVTMREGIKLLDDYPTDVLHVSYEKLCENPEKLCRCITSFTGLREDETFFNYAKKVLSSPPPRSKFKLPVELRGPFNQTLEAVSALEKTPAPFV